MLQSSINADLLKRASKIHLIAFDVDGVLTDGRLYYGSEGECMKTFYSRDGVGIRKAQKQGLSLAIITGRKSVFVEKRAADLGISHVFQNIQDKLPVFEALCKNLNISPEQAAYMGDDTIDLNVLNLVGLAACPQDAFPLVKKSCHWVAQNKGGWGAARELCELILTAKGL